MTPLRIRLQVQRERFERFYLRSQPLLRTLPALMVMFALAIVIALAMFVPRSIRSRYEKAARQAVAERKLDLAKVYYERLKDEGESIDPQDELNWALILAEQGELTAADELLDRLAPEGERRGYAAAHKLKAQRLVSRLNRTPAAELLEPLHWHLTQMGPADTAQDYQLWTAYYLAAGKPDAAIEQLTLAAEKTPDLWFNVATLNRRFGDAAGAVKPLHMAEAHLREKLSADPYDRRRRIMLASALLASDRDEEAELVLREGLQVQTSVDLQQAIADVLLFRLRRLRDSEQFDFAEANQILRAAFQQAPNYDAVYTGLLQLYRDLNSETERQEMRQSLADLIVNGDDTAFAHFAIGSIDWSEGKRESALWHLEKAYQLDPSLLEIVNNLAWVLAEGEAVDLERAEELARSAVKQDPISIRFRDTLATILVKREKWDEALVEYERLLKEVSNKQPIHEQLAKIYEHLGQKEIAEAHRRKGGE